MIVPCNPVSAAPGLYPDIWCGRGLASTRHPSYRRSRHTAAQYYKWVLTSTCNFHHLLHLRHDDAGHHRSNFSIPQMFLCSNLRFHGISYSPLPPSCLECLAAQHGREGKLDKIVTSLCWCCISRDLDIWSQTQGVNIPVVTRVWCSPSARCLASNE